MSAAREEAERRLAARLAVHGFTFRAEWAQTPEGGTFMAKEAVRSVVDRLLAGQLTAEQATNAICRLQRPPANLEEVGLTVTCPYCGRTPGNRCTVRGGSAQAVGGPAHPSRLALARRASR